MRDFGFAAAICCAAAVWGSVDDTENFAYARTELASRGAPFLASIAGLCMHVCTTPQSSQFNGGMCRTLGLVCVRKVAKFAASFSSLMAPVG